MKAQETRLRDKMRLPKTLFFTALLALTFNTLNTHAASFEDSFEWDSHPAQKIDQKKILEKIDIPDDKKLIAESKKLEKQEKEEESW